MTAAIVGIGITSSCGETFKDIEQSVGQGKSGISKIDYFDTSDLTCGIAGNVSKKVWEDVLQIAEMNELDWSSSLSIYTIQRLLKSYSVSRKQKIGLSLGTCNGGIHSLAEYFDTSDEKFLKNYPPYVQSKDIANYFDFQGPKYCFNSACAASANAIAYGAEMVNNGDADIVVTGGCDPMSEWVFAGFNSLRTFNKKNCMPYGKEFGLNLGEAATYFLIEDKERAIEQGHKIYAEILGHGLSNDAYHPTAPDKNGSGIAYAIKMALRNSNLETKDILYINSHGTGTKANDSAEYNGFKAVFGDNMPFVSSMKGYVGHNLGAAASTELAISLIGMNSQKVLYPNFNLTDYRDDCNDDHLLKKPYSFAHSNMYVAVASSINKIGVDIEFINKKKKARAKILTESERQLVSRYGFTRIWTLKEAIAKYHRTGLPQINAVDIKQINSSDVIYMINKTSGKLQYRFLDVIPSYRLCVVTKEISSFAIYNTGRKFKE